MMGSSHSGYTIRSGTTKKHSRGQEPAGIWRLYDNGDVEVVFTAIFTKNTCIQIV